MDPVGPRLLHQAQKGGNGQPRLDISAKGFSVYITESTPMPLLAVVLGVIREGDGWLLLFASAGNHIAVSTPFLLSHNYHAFLLPKRHSIANDLLHATVPQAGGIFLFIDLS